MKQCKYSVKINRFNWIKTIINKTKIKMRINQVNSVKRYKVKLCHLISLILFCQLLEC